jgi:hypothetical protein
MAATVLTVVGLSSASSIGAATDGLTSDSMLANANIGAAFSGGERVPDDPDAPVRTGRWVEDTPEAVALAGGPTQTAAAATAPEVIRIPTPRAAPTVQFAALDADQAIASAQFSIPLSRVALTPTHIRTPRAEPRVTLVVVNQNPVSPGSGLDVTSGVFSEPLAAAAPPQSSPAFDMKRLTLRVTSNPKVGKKGRWFVFAAGSGEAFGLNLIRDPLRGWKPAGWSVEQLAEFGKAQLGIGWRKGARQFSLSAARREIGAYGVSREDTVIGVSFSVSGRPPATPRYEQRLPKAH